jgi:hypothetical protein
MHCAPHIRAEAGNYRLSGLNRLTLAEFAATAAKTLLRAKNNAV